MKLERRKKKGEKRKGKWSVHQSTATQRDNLLQKADRKENDE